MGIASVSRLCSRWGGREPLLHFANVCTVAEMVVTSQGGFLYQKVPMKGHYFPVSCKQGCSWSWLGW